MADDSGSPPTLAERMRQATGHDWQMTASGREVRIVERGTVDKGVVVEAPAVMWRTIEHCAGLVCIEYHEYPADSGAYLQLTSAVQPPGDAMKMVCDQLGFGPGKGHGQRLVLDEEDTDDG